MVSIPKELTMLGVEKLLENGDSVPSYPRGYLGISQLGHKCPRFLWYSFRWAFKESHSRRKMRIFERGDMEEDRIVNDLILAGVHVRSRQLEVRFNQHIIGHIDGIVEGIPDSKKPHLLEIKTMKDSSFTKLKKDKLEKAVPVYWCQAHLYMHLIPVERCLFICTNKDTEERYYERFPVDHDLADFLISRAIDISKSEYPPERINNNPSWFECKMCPALEVCHYDAPIMKNCRTCVNSDPYPEHGNKHEWYCNKHNRRYLLEHQREGCEEHSILESLSGTSN